MMIFDYYNNLRKKRVRLLTCLCAVMFALTIVPMTAHAEVGDIITQLQGGTLYIGDTKEFTFEVEGATKYVWYYNLPNRSNIRMTSQYAVRENGKNVFIFKTNITSPSKAPSTIEYNFLSYRASYNPTEIYCVATTSSGNITSDVVKLHSIDKYGVQYYMNMATSVVSYVLTSMSSFLGFVTANPILLLFFGILYGGIAIVFLVRIIKS